MPGFGGHSILLKTTPFDKSHTSSYRRFYGNYVPIFFRFRYIKRRKMA